MALCLTCEKHLFTCQSISIAKYVSIIDISSYLLVHGTEKDGITCGRSGEGCSKTAVIWIAAASWMQEMWLPRTLDVSMQKLRQEKRTERRSGRS
ncbi:hypothetical protein RvY_03160-2 [Ramazzottius varieornatus]|uniref:Uncharacterized protein n=1 Tax=Ramazzottius varieornatus TaxID=947166 RepID=A0A1D1UQJ7_RAMVA|nr:hypothetical protein RvY_03160-2 [Ramazzottius varieornatus]